MNDEPLVFFNRDYGPRSIPDDSTIIEVTDEDDTDVHIWQVEALDVIVLQQGYDRITLTAEGIKIMQSHVRVVPVAQEAE